MRYFRLVRAVFKNCKAFSFSLMLLFFLQTALITVVETVPGSMRQTIQTYSDEYHMPQATIYTSLQSDSLSDEIRNIHGISDVEASMCLDVRLQLPDGQLVVPRLMSVEADFQLFHTADGTATEVENGLVVSDYFASMKDLQAGDALRLRTPDGEKEILISQIASTPECMIIYRDETSWYDSTDFGYLYISREGFDELFSTAGYANRWLIEYEAGLSQEQKQEALDAACDVLGESVSASFLYEDSPSHRILEEALSMMDASAAYIPGVVLILGACFSCLFIHQIIQRSRHTIGVLRALGFTWGRVTWVFMLFTGTLTLAAAILGGAFGLCLNEIIYNMYRTKYSLPYILRVNYAWVLPMIMLLMLLFSEMVCVWCAQSIKKIDPVKIFSGGSLQAVKNVEFPKSLRLTPFNRITLASMVRNKRRFFLSAACIAACICMVTMSLAFIKSKNKGEKVTFENRLHYTFTVFFESEPDIAAIRAIDGVENAEPVSISYGTFTAGDLEESEQINGISTGSSLVTPVSVDLAELEIPRNGIILEESFAEEMGLSEGDTVQVNGTDITVAAITRELVNRVNYVSLEQAEELGLDPRAAFVHIDDAAGREDIKKQLSEMDGFSHLVELEKQRAGLHSTIETLTIPALMFALFSIAIGLVLVSNMILLVIRQRRKEYATLMVIGVTKGKLFRMSLFEGLCQFVAAIGPGILSGLLISRFVLKKLSSASQYFPLIQLPQISALSSGLTLVCVLLGCLVSLKALYSIRLTEVLNERENRM